MKKGLTELVFILDRSGSMRGLEEDTIGGFNGMLEKQRQQEGEANVTTVLFDDRREVIHDRLPLEAVQPLTREEYFVRGCTALLDAMGSSINKVKEAQRALPDDRKAEKVIFTITTDGLENASEEFGYAQVRSLVEAQKAQGWEFLFLGANFDAMAEASRFGIARERSARYVNDGSGVRVNFEAVGQAVSAMRAAPRMSTVGAGWKQEIEDYFREIAGKQPE